MTKIFGIAITLLALAIIITPQYENCEAHGQHLTLANGSTTPMRCFWSARAEIAVGVPIFTFGVMMLFVNRKETFRVLGVAGVVLGIFVLLIPTSLIGVCKSMMVCHTVMKPSLVVFGSLVIVTSLTGLLLTFRKRE
jgi:hypothetical protein